MSIASEISQLNTNKTNIKAAIVGKNPTVSPTDNLSQWPTSIGSIVELKGETKSVSPSTSQQIITPSSGKNGITQITVNPVTSSIDANIIAENIKKDIAILGVTGNYQGSGGGGATGYTLTVSNEADSQTIEAIPTSGDRVITVNPGNSAQDIVAIHMNLAKYGNGWIKVNNQIIWSENPIGDYWYDQWIVLTADSVAYRYYNDSCLLEGTKIMLSDGKTEKNIEDVTYDDELLVWDFDNGCLSKAKPIWIKKAESADYWFLNKYRSGKVLKTTGKSETGWGHRTFDINKNKFIYTTESVSDRISTLDGIDTHMSCERIEEPCEYYNIITEKHFNLFANRILTSCSLNNLYPIKDMKYVKDNRALRNISDYDNIPQKWFDGLRLAENNTDIDKLNKYVKNLMEKNYV